MLNFSKPAAVGGGMLDTTKKLQQQQHQAQQSNGFDSKLHEALLRVQNHNYNEDTRLVLEALESDS